MKKIISLLAALSMISTFGITNVFATDTITFSVSDPVELSDSEFEDYNSYLVDDLGEDEFVLESGYKAYSIDLEVSGIPSTVSSNPARVMLWEVFLTFGSDMLQDTQPSYALEDGAFGASSTSFEDTNMLKVAFVTSAWASMKAGTAGSNLATVIIAAKEGSTATVSDANLTIYVNKTKTEYGTATGALGKSVPAGTLSFGSSTPTPDPDPVEAAVDNTTGEVTLTRNANATLPASAVLDGQKVKLFSNEFTGVTANKRFAITHNGETKRYGTSIGEYFGINGNGTVSGIVKVAVLFPEGDENDFTINMYDAE